MTGETPVAHTLFFAAMFPLDKKAAGLLKFIHRTGKAPSQSCFVRRPE